MVTSISLCEPGQREAVIEAWGRAARLGIVPTVILFASPLLADGINLVELIAQRYRAEAYCVLPVYILQQFTIGIVPMVRLCSPRQSS